MSKIVGGNLAPREGVFPVSVADEATAKAGLDSGALAFKQVGERRVLAATVKAGEKFPGDDSHIYEVGELVAGETVPRAGVWFNSAASSEHDLAAGATFPAGEGDFIWVRE